TTSKRHPVDDLLSLFRRCRDNKPSRAHAKGEDTPMVHICREAIARRREQWMPCPLTAVLDFVNQCLRMLNPHSQGKGLCLYAETPIIQQIENIPARVSGSK